MKIKKPTLLFILLTVVLYSCSHYNVVHVQKSFEISKKNGVYYALPKTIVAIDVTITKTEKIKGQYYAFANKYLGLKNVISTNSTTYEISDIAFDTFTEPDSNQFYFVEMNRCNKRKNSLYLSLSESGTIQSINIEPDIKEFQNSETILKTNQNTSNDNYNYFVESNIFEKIDTIIEKVYLDTTIIERKTFKRSFVEKNLDQKAKEAADFIMRTKENRFNLLSGSAEVNYEKASIQYMNDELAKLENDYLNLFTGIIKTKTIKYRIVYTPEKTKAGMTEKLFLFSTKEGIVDSISSGWYPVEIQLDNNNITKNLSSFIANKSKLSGKKHGFYYRLPEYGTINIKYKTKIIASTTLLINQLGTISSLPHKKNCIQFYPNSGALKTIKLMNQ